MSEQTIVIAGGCFWGVQELIRHVQGVVHTEVGYCGGPEAVPHPTYNTVKTGNSGHAEAVKIVFNDQQLPLMTLLTDHFFKFHDPTTPNRQGNDVGTQYRSAIFFTDQAQLPIIEKAIENVTNGTLWRDELTTEVAPLTTFWPAEPEHQDYLQHYPEGYNCHFYRK